jgi:hypothetical protein
MNAGEMIEYTAVETMAETYRLAVAKIREAAETLRQQTDALITAYADDSSYAFGIDLRFRGENYHTSEDGIASIIDQLKRECWGKIIQKLNIRRLMSSKRAKELDDALAGRRPHYDEPAPEWPEITPETIQSVAQGYIMSANEFLEEAIAEEYDFWRPRQNSQYKTNAAFWKLGRKIIESYMVRPAYSGGRFQLGYSDRCNHVTALDNIFHMLDGKGPTESYKGELASAIEMSEDGHGETQYFRFKCYKDLLDLFNQIAAKRDRLGRERRSA